MATDKAEAEKAMADKLAALQAEYAAAMTAEKQAQEALAAKLKMATEAKSAAETAQATTEQLQADEQAFQAAYGKKN